MMSDRLFTLFIVYLLNVVYFSRLAVFKMKFIGQKVEMDHGDGWSLGSDINSILVSKRNSM